MKHIN